MFRFGSSGSAILLVLLVLLVLTILGITLSNMDRVHLKILSSERTHQAAYYYAEAGLTQQIEILRNKMELLYRDPRTDCKDALLAGILGTPIIAPEFEDFDGEKVKLKITCIKNKAVKNRDELILMSICSIGEISRSVRALVEIKWTDPGEPDFKLDHTNFTIVGWEEIR